MAKQIEGVYEKVIECAKEEFGEKGYVDASLRTIAAGADTSTGSIYTRFGDKAGLFQAIVQPAADKLKEMFLEIQESFHHFDAETQREQMARYTLHGMDRLLDYMYENKDVFRLLLDASYGTQFQSFVDELVDIEVDYTYRYLQVIGAERAKDEPLTLEIVHMVVTAFMNGMFEVIRHDMSREDAGRYIELLSQYHRAGFCAILPIES
ncbi:TetR/AcrR family transcriptional regulator [Lacrimispora sp. NSJ-141]|uniref:TetR/AcrR family transcriptional regulator n=1 Tax=Lientehia hominis TaxID=2897778 RepID=A0AAP2RJA6_9FIRM|nr:TetR/AcrR family transcriptional regulator [Lientehia hominis]